ncbi:MAG: oxidoreductase-like domain-containing protein [Nevskia sp.]|nr:hypothetical protein [Gammaproteobacteria bacterium]MDH4459055.1 oxidoreductase-like domain-containing protein [Nevskia sp.]
MNTPLPPKPEPPYPGECCESGCTQCVYTVYDEALERWREALKQASAAATPEAPEPDPAPG